LVGSASMDGFVAAHYPPSGATPGL
jgi:hypothetical protein